MQRSGKQQVLFDTPGQLPNGFLYRPNFITETEEEELLATIPALPLTHPETEGYAAKRRHIGFGWGYDFERKKLIPGPPLPPFLRSVQYKIAKWLDVPKQRVAEALINEYPPGTSIGWHKDNEPFEVIAGLSLAGWCRMRLRPLPFGSSKHEKPLSIELEPRSLYLMQGKVREDWQHSVAATKTLRYSITFRTLPNKGRR